MAAKTTELDAVNICLNVIGEASINALTGTLPFEVTLARSIIDETTRELCQDDYIFNKEENVTLTPNVSDNIAIPANYIQIIANTTDTEFTIRYNGGSPILYSMTDKTSTFTSDITVDIVYLLDFEDLPEAAKRYVNIRAARVYADRLVGSKDIRAFTAQDEMEAKAKLGNYQHGVGRHNMLQNPSVKSTLNRTL